MKTVPTPEQQRFIDETMSKPEVSQWLAQYNARTVIDFLLDYHKQRKYYIQIGSTHVRDRNERLTHIINKAERILPQIQQKKLWDLQCQWRAELIDVPGVSHGGDFIEMESKVLSLDFLPPITPDEVQTLKDWLYDFNASRRTHAAFGFQDYRYLVEDNAPNDFAAEEFPLFYDFADAKTKTVPLWKVLPDKRGEKEMNYYWEGHQNLRRKETLQAEEENDDPESDSPETTQNEWDDKPFLHSHGKPVIDFAKMIEEHRVYEAVDCYFNESEESDYQLEWALDILQKADKRQPIEANANWREGILRAAHRYEHNKIADALDIAYENYLFRRNMGIAPPEDEQDSRALAKSKYWAECILEGREFLGEPRDFNF